MKEAQTGDGRHHILESEKEREWINEQKKLSCQPETIKLRLTYKEEDLEYAQKLSRDGRDKPKGKEENYFGLQYTHTTRIQIDDQ